MSDIEGKISDIIPVKSYWVKIGDVNYFRIEDGDEGTWFRLYSQTLEPAVFDDALEGLFQESLSFQFKDEE